MQSFFLRFAYIIFCRLSWGCVGWVTSPRRFDSCVTACVVRVTSSLERLLLGWDCVKDFFELVMILSINGVDLILTV